MFALAAIAVIADSLPATDSEFGRWIGPVLTTALSLAASYFAYLSARDKMRFDSERALERADLQRYRSEVEEHKKHADEQRLQIEALTTEVANLKAQLSVMQQANAKHNSTARNRRSTDAGAEGLP